MQLVTRAYITKGAERIHMSSSVQTACHTCLPVKHINCHDINCSYACNQHKPSSPPQHQTTTSILSLIGTRKEEEEQQQRLLQSNNHIRDMTTALTMLKKKYASYSPARRKYRFSTPPLPFVR
jgi:hypothetical protein